MTKRPHRNDVVGKPIKDANYKTIIKIPTMAKKKEQNNKKDFRLQILRDEDKKK